MKVNLLYKSGGTPSSMLVVGLPDVDSSQEGSPSVWANNRLPVILPGEFYSDYSYKWSGNIEANLL